MEGEVPLGRWRMVTALLWPPSNLPTVDMRPGGPWAPPPELEGLRAARPPSPVGLPVLSLRLLGLRQAGWERRPGSI